MKTSAIVGSRDLLSASAPLGAALLGGKGASLAALSLAGLPVPDWFAIAPAAQQAGMTAELRADIAAALATLSGSDRDLMVAVRSSAVEEDADERSFAGQFESYLFVQPQDVPDRVQRVWESARAARVAAYRQEAGTADAQALAVVVQRMVDADVSGVAFSADPVSGRRGIAVVSAVYGLGTALVSGEADADTYRVDRNGSIVERVIACKRTAHRRAANVQGVVGVELPPDAARAPALNDDQVRALASLVRDVERLRGRPQDIEWAMKDRAAYLLQARPITSLARLQDPDASLTIWDNSNIAESYGGITTPLTFSFARHAYYNAYRRFFELMRVPERTLARSDGAFHNMLGLVRGRIYYNLLNWYRLLALLPGFRLNRRFMETMMGVREELPADLERELARAGGGDRVRDALAVIAVSAALARRLATVRTDIAAFQRRLDETLNGAGDPSGMRLDELVAEYRRLEGKLATGWDAPLINDFFAMIFYGVLRRLCGRWCGTGGDSLANDLLLGEGGMISAVPAARVEAMARAVARDPALAKLLCDAPTPVALRAALASDPPARALREYLDEFGDRCASELKLESPTLRDDPTPLLRAIGRLAADERTVAAPREDAGRSAREAAQQRVAGALRGDVFRRALFAWVLGHARARIVARENLRFDRTRLFGRIRVVFVEIGRRLNALGALAQPRDVFYLELEEILGFVEGTACAADLGALAQARKAEFDRYRAQPAPPDRFESHGPVYAGDLRASMNGAPAQSGVALAEASATRSGIGCCPGRVRGRVRIVSDPATSSLHAGEILVAERTDPGWVVLFPAAAGILVERGSLLSHAAIVSREMGIPSIVAIAGLTSWLHDGDLVEFDGSTGSVTKVAHA
ncbi:MAG: phosphoenolpyruvate synthase [Candidatus Eremiobacteraeota bacterium]|nr:phosphoenolpyruvate synthase [Candidatus Eremiobacteraeota bacterium]